MIFRNSHAWFNLKCPTGKRETEAFHWIRKETELSAFIGGLDFSYQKGFKVLFYVPREWSAIELEDKVDRTINRYNELFLAQ